MAYAHPGCAVNAIKIRLDKVSYHFTPQSLLLHDFLSLSTHSITYPFFTLPPFLHSPSLSSLSLPPSLLSHKVNTVSKALQMCRTARRAGLAVIVGYSESGPESLDSFIADLGVGLGAGQIAAGGLLSGDKEKDYF
jgi:Enolase, C-terminal TIM barrel domain